MSCGMVASEAMKRTFSPMFALLATAALAQTPPPVQRQRSPMAETPNTDILLQTGARRDEIEHRIITKRNVANDGVKEVVRQGRLFKALGKDGCIGIEPLCDARC